MNITYRTRGFIAATLLVLVSLAAGLSHAQTVNVNSVGCPSATVTFGNGVININTGTCGGTVTNPPSISSVSPTSGIPNAPVTINGANLSGASVTIGGIAANITSNTGSTITTSVPSTAPAASVSIVVTVANLAPASAGFTVLAPPPPAAPTVSLASPTSGVPGTVVTLTGANFSGVTSVTIGGISANFSINSATQITTSVPATATVASLGGVVVTVPTFTPGTIGFTVLAPPPPVINTVSPPTGFVNTVLTIAGTGLSGASVTIGGIAASVTTSSATSITTSVPAGVALGVANIVVTTVAGTASSSAFNVAAAPVGDITIDGNTVPNPSKLAFIIPPGHGGANGAGSEVNAYAMPPTRCLTVPALSRSWQHNIDLADYKGKNAFDFFVMQGGESLSYKFTVGNVDASGGFIYNDAANAFVRPTFISITAAPCDFDTSKLVVGATRDSCYQTGLNGNSVNWANITGPLPAAYCRLIKGNTYYMNLRFQDGRPASLGGSPTTDSCLSGNCGGIIQVL